MKLSIFRGKSARTRLFSLLSVAVIVLFFAANLLLSYFGIYRTLFLDVTSEGLYTLSDAMLAECDFLSELKDEDGSDRGVKITFCTDQDYLNETAVTRVIFYMAIELQNRFPSHVKVELVNVENNPTAVAAYKTTSLSTISPSDIIVSYGDTYRIVSAASFWTKGSDGNYWSYNGEYKMLSLMKSVTSIDRPAAYFVTGHGETVYDPDHPERAGSVNSAALFDLLTERGLRVRTLDLSVAERVPEDCALLIINCPTSDFEGERDHFGEFYYVSELEKLDRYLVNGSGAVMLTKDYGVTLPALEEFAADWGIGFGTGQVTDKDSSLEDEEETDSRLIAVYSTDKTSYGYAIYEEFAKLSSSPRMILSNAGCVYNAFGDSSTVNEAGTYYTNRTYASFLATSSAAQEKIPGPGGQLLLNRQGKLDLCSVTARVTTDSFSSEKTYSYFFAANSADFFSNELLGNASYANFDIVSALINNISRTDEYGSTDVGGTSLNSKSYGGKQLTVTKLSETETKIYSPDAKEVVRVNRGITKADITVYTVLVAIPPVAVLVLGVILCIRRRFL